MISRYMTQRKQIRSMEYQHLYQSEIWSEKTKQILQYLEDSFPPENCK